MPVSIPITIDNTHFPWVFPFQADPGLDVAGRNVSTGPYLKGTDLWTIAWRSGELYTAYKSSDGGITWTEEDSANAISSFRRLFSVRRSGDILYVVYVDDGGGPAVVSINTAAFDLSTGLWTASGVPDFIVGPLKTVNDVDTFDFSVSAGVFNLVYSRRVAADPFPFTIQTSTYAGVSWSAEVAKGTEFTAPIQTGTTIEADGTMRVFYSQRQSSGASPLSPNEVRSFSVSPTGTVSASNVVFSDILQYMAGGDNFTYPSFCPGCEFSGTLFIPYSQRRPPAAVAVPYLLYGTPGSWNTSAISPTTDSDGVPDGQGSTGVFTYALAISGKVHIIWSTYYNDPDSGDKVIKIRHTSTTNGTTFDPITTIYDESLNPPADVSGAPVSITGFSAADIGGGNIGIFLNMDNTDQGRHFFSFAPAGSPLTLDCGNPPDGQVGVFYTHTFIVGGGAGPYTFSKPSGTFPPGLTLNASTGVLSGIPTTAGTFQFTIEVTDSLSATASCAITITVPVATGNNLYTLKDYKLTDDDYGQIYPFYVTYFAPTFEQEQALGLGGGPKMLSYFSAFIEANSYLNIGCSLTVTFYGDTLLNPWALRVSRVLAPNATFDMECAGGMANGQRIAAKFASWPLEGATDNAFSLSKVIFFIKQQARLAVRGSSK